VTGLTLGIIDPFHPAVIDTIRSAAPPEWRLCVTEGPSETERAAALASADIAFVMATRMPRSLLAQAPGLRFIQKLGAGTDSIDTAYCTEAGIAVARLQAGNAIPVAEHTLLLMLAACRHLPRLDARTRAGGWDKEAVRGENRHLYGKTVGIVGFGAIGQRVARLLAGFDARLVYHDPRRLAPDAEAARGVLYLELDTLLQEADVVSLHLPLLPETRNLLSAERIALMKPGAILVNAARGGIVDEAALAEALRSGHLHGAGIDAFGTEPPVGNPLLDIGTTVVTPHCAGATIDNFASVAERAVANACAFLAGEALDPAEIVVAAQAGLAPAGRA
jgi:D-3-phosphoglycerate dehydrogenase